MTYVGKKPADIIATAVDTTTGTFSGDLTVDTSTLYVDSANNRVGVGTVSPSELMHLSSSGGFNILLERTGGSPSESIIKNSGNMLQFSNNVTGIRFDTGTTPSEAMRIDSSGNLLVSKTAGGSGTAGIQLESGGRGGFTKDGAYVTFQNRLSSDGEISRFMKDGTTVGSIGVNNSYLFVGSGSTNLRFHDGVPAILPSTSGGGSRDNAIDLGSSGARYKDFYLSGIIAGASQVTRDVNNASVAIAGGNDSNQGSNVIVYGPSHASLANVTRFRVGSSESARIDSSGNLLVGKTSTSTTVAGIVLNDDGRLFATGEGGSGHQAARFTRLSNDGDIVNFYKDGTDVGSISSRAGTSINVNSESGDLHLQRGGTTGLVVNPTYSIPGSDAGASLGISSQRWSDLYLSGGVYLGGTGSANYLDDYEEGTWTPTLVSDSTNPTVTYTANVSGSYIKVGDVVHVMGRVNTTSVSGGTGNARIGGLPFATGAERNAGTVGYISQVTNSSGYTTTGLNPLASASSMRLVQSGSGVGGATVAIGNIGNGFDLTFSHTYKV